MVHGWPQETVLASGRTVLLVEEGVNLVGHLREKGQVLPRKTLGTFPRLSILVEGGELDLARSVITVVEDGGFDASNANLMDGLVVFAHGELSFLASLEALKQGTKKQIGPKRPSSRAWLLSGPTRVGRQRFHNVRQSG